MKMNEIINQQFIVMKELEYSKKYDQINKNPNGIP